MVNINQIKKGNMLVTQNADQYISKPRNIIVDEQKRIKAFYMPYDESIYLRKSDGFWSKNGSEDDFGYTTESLIRQEQYWKIHTVENKRGVIFKIGDLVKCEGFDNFKIGYFRWHDGEQIIVHKEPENGQKFGAAITDINYDVGEALAGKDSVGITHV